MAAVTEPTSTGNVLFGDIGDYYVDKQQNSQPADSSSPADPSDQATTKDMFLKLLVAQIKNQDPLNPQDGTQFLAQLAQFSSLEQLVDMDSQLASIKDLVSGMQSNSTGDATADQSGSSAP